MPTHDEICQDAITAVDTSDRDRIIAAFVGSLSTRNLPARSAFGSYVVLQQFENHPFQESALFSMGDCAYCGTPSELSYVQTDDRVMRYPFQVQHTNVQYSAYDLATFSRRAIETPTGENKERLRRLFVALRALPTSAQLNELNKSLQGVIKSNKHERMILLETFGYAGILCPNDHQHYTDGFVGYDLANSQQPPEFFKREWAYPVRFWTGADGINESMVARYFGPFL